MSHFNWKKFYNVGNHLNDHSNEEEYQRFAIGRYYYSCYEPVKNYYENSFRKTLPSNDSHATLINILKSSPFIEEQKLGIKLDNLRKNRNFADYMDKTQEYMANFAIVSHGFQAEIRRIVLTT